MTNNNNKSGNNAWMAYFSGLAILFAIAAGYSIYIFFLGNPANFEDGDVAKGHPLGLLGIIYRGGIAAKGVPACAACHSPTGAGIPSQYPRVGGQWAEYNAAQLLAFREGTRKNSSQMTTIATKLSDQEMKAVADYMAGLH